MGPLSARLLMQRGRPKSDRLGKIRSLDGRESGVVARASSLSYSRG
ncbi:LRWD1 isoform 9 [Pongo abelii]|uniref:LRWD1 isoform 7 n=2 Tax=Pongo abelii TaxID=9601 RepID=A0A2J8XU28_PONAB|nr:LRWD1 isoform 7 [Pongo abelii]PNJ85549.1 LRWD1 isoform 9 [Pongo abelii]